MKDHSAGAAGFYWRRLGVSNRGPGDSGLGVGDWGLGIRAACESLAVETPGPEFRMATAFSGFPGSCRNKAKNAVDFADYLDSVD